MRCIIKDIGPMKTNLLPLVNGVYFTAGIADEEHRLFGLFTEDKTSFLEIWGRTSP